VVERDQTLEKVLIPKSGVSVSDDPQRDEYNFFKLVKAQSVPSLLMHEVNKDASAPKNGRAPRALRPRK